MKNSNVTRLIESYWMVVSIAWGLVFLKYNGIQIVGLGEKTGEFLALSALFIMAIAYFSTILVIKRKSFVKEDFVIGFVLPLVNLIWNIDLIGGSLVDELQVVMIAGVLAINTFSLMIRFILNSFEE